jgi:quercetin dioxygenase-like cupin family protein
MSSTSLSAPTLAPLEPGLLSVVADGFARSASPAQVPPGDERRWVQLVATEEYDVWLIAWPSGASLGMHDHGGSSAAVQVVAGQLEERHLDHAAPGVVRDRTLGAGDAISFGPTHVHALRNDADAEALSVHVYSPPLRHMSYFD